MYGHLEGSGIGTALEWGSIPNAEDLKVNCGSSNLELLGLCSHLLFIISYPSCK